MAETKKTAAKAASKVATKTVAKEKEPTKKSSSAAQSPEKTSAKASAAVPAKSTTKAAAKPAVKTAAKEATTPVVKSSAKGSSKDVASASKASISDTHSFSPEYLVLMQKDPNWMQAFWEVSEKRVKKATKGGAKLVLRLYDVSSDLTVRAHRKRAFRDFQVPSDARSWYIQNGTQSSHYEMSLGTIDSSGNFEAIMESRDLQVFGSDGQYLGAQEDRFVRASLGGAMPGGFGSSQLGLSSQMSLPWTSSLAGSSETGSSWGNLSSASAQSWNQSTAWQGLGKDFFLWVKTRLIVYGGTRPDAHLQVRGEPFPLNPDGTFSFEQDLPDSTQIIPVFATDKDGDFPTTIVPIVVKRTE